MSEDKKKNIELNIAIGLAIALFVTVSLIFMKNTKQQEKPSTTEMKSPLPQQENPLILESQFTEEGPKETAIEITEGETNKIMEEKSGSEEEKQEIILLKDLPLDSIPPGSDKTMEDEETLEPSAAVQPSIEDIKKLKQKGLIIY